MNEYIQSVRVLQQIEREGRHLDDSLDSGSSPFVQQICYGVLRHWYYLSAILSELLDKPLPAKHSDIRLLIMCGLYSLDELHRPDHASVNAAVEASKKLRKAWASRLVNGVLRRYGRERSALRQKVTDENAEARTNHPTWMIERFSSSWPDDSNLFEINNSRAPMSLRVNLGRTTREACRDMLQSAGIDTRVSQVAETGLVLETPVPADSLPGLKEGLLSIQDEAPQLAAPLLDPQEGERILDACAAPGGKTGHLLEYAPGISLIAIDRDIKRIDRIQENLDRLGVKATIIHAALEDYQDDMLFDRILLDVPCSATGIIRRHPDIKLLRRKSDVDKLQVTQQVLLNKAFDLLKVGGSLLYSTCSILPEENHLLVEQFAASRPDAQLRELPDVPVPENHVRRVSTGLQFLPEPGGHDGFYYARLEKSGERVPT